LGGEKISKSKGHKIDPLEIVDRIRSESGCQPEMALDALRYFLLREVTFGLDGEWSIEAILGRFNADLANDLGNLLNRFLPLVCRHNEGRIPAPARADEVVAAAKQAVAEWASAMEKYDFSGAMRAVWAFLGVLNQWIDARAPWALAKKGEKEELDRVFYCLAEGLRIIAGMISPVMPNTAVEIHKRLGLDVESHRPGWEDLTEWGRLPQGSMVTPGEPLFPRVVPAGDSK
nr:class I tRNA ligase family protein [Armatimonadota bacterium]NIM23209.1 class I tRNA ligase family protein [Armatimonadota bacterium]NIM67077.1 class I tRNA ligase family protein [Armatimonadota bacterium]NIM75604.1 class I tRNA ligase family protein [Armatimonadota bacterium]NIN05266.1 class I tRNA ligase family protein [Armatimonadota bacterium]